MRKHLISQLAHVELLTPKLQETLWFFKELLGLEESGEEGGSTYLRGWGDFFHHSLKVTEAKQSGLGHMAWRTEDADTLEKTVTLLEDSGLGEGWTEGDVGHGPAYRFRTPEGHLAEVFWEVEWYQAPPEMQSPIRVHPQKYVGRGAAVRRIDHVTLAASEVKPCRELFQSLGFNYRESTLEDDTDKELGAWLAATNLSHDIAFFLDATGARGRLQHVAFWQDSREEVLRTADIMRDHDISIEFGPDRHGISEAFFLYIFEPGGNRIEIYSGGYLQFAPDWGPVHWYVSENPGLYWRGTIPESAYTYNTPPLQEDEIRRSE